MRKRIITTFVTAVAALAIVALPAGAGNSTPTGVRFSMLGGADPASRTILANTAFYVRHGFRTVAGDSSPQEIQQSSIKLSVNGAKQNGIIDQEFSATTPKVLTGKFSLFNFPNGLAPGTYVLTITFTFQGKDILTRDVTVYSLATCQYGTTDGLLCAPPS
jgi:hypothetical protein